MADRVTLYFTKGRWKGRMVNYRKGYLIVKVKSADDTDIAIETAFNNILDPSWTLEARIGTWGYVEVQFDLDIPGECETLTALAEVEYAEPSLEMEPANKPDDPLLYDPDEPESPNDKYYWQWAVDTLGMPEAWEIEKGSDRVLIGLLDSGIVLEESYNDYMSQGGEPALGGNLRNCVSHEDFDSSRFIAGTNFLLDNKAPYPADENGHGTKMAGIIAAKENNEIGTAGMNWVSPVYVCRVLDEADKADSGIVYQAINEVLEYAANSDQFDQVVINLSLTFKDQLYGMEIGTFNDFCSTLADKGGLMVCATGNEGDIMRFPAAAAASKPDQIVAVGAVDQDGNLNPLSNHCIPNPDLADEHGEIPPVELEVTVVAPGYQNATTLVDGSYGEEGGTSIAAAHVTGLISLMWSHNPKLTSKQIVNCLKRSCLLVENAPIPVDENGDVLPGGVKDFYGSGLIQPVAALMDLDWEISIVESSISFIDVPAGEEPSQEIQVNVMSCCSVTFEVRVDLGGDDFGIVAGTYTHKPEDGPVFKQLVATYRDTLPDFASTTVTILCDDCITPQVFEVQISANRVEPRNSVIFLALDKSGSMKAPSGIGTYSRLDVLKYSAKILIDLIEENSAAGIISFDESAHQVAGLTVIDESNPVASRLALKSALNGLTANGWTSIGGGLSRASEDLDAVPPDLVEGEETKAIIVLTDGKENRAPFIADLLTEDFPAPVYAIGMGTPDALEPDALVTLSNITGGYTVITGPLDETSEYAIAEFYSKILAEINGDSVVLDPSFRYRPRHPIDFEIKVTRADKQLNIILMKYPQAPVLLTALAPCTPGALRIEENPDGRLFVAGTEIKGALVTRGDRLIRYRIPLPLNLSDGRTIHQGTWQVRVGIEEHNFNNFLAGRKFSDKKVKFFQVHGFRLAVNVNVSSELRFRARLIQDGYEPGSHILMRATITQNGVPLNDPSTQINAHITDPDGGEEMIRMELRYPGLYQAQFQTTVPGVYPISLVASGHSSHGDHYRREQLLTGIVRNI